MKNKKKILIIDGNNMLYRAYYKFGNLRTSKGVLSGLVYGFPYILHSLIGQHLPDDLIVVFDGGRDKERIRLCPEYKKRDKKAGFDADDFYRQKDEVVRFLRLMGVKVVQVKKREADDIIWLLTRKLKRENNVVIVSSDKDFNQLISNNVSIWNPKANKRFTTKNLKKEVGYEPHECVDYLILDGDTSDNIKGMPGVGPKTALKFLEEQGSIKSYLISDKPEISKFKRKELEEVFLLNRQLIDIKRFVRKNIKVEEITMTVPKMKKGISTKELAYFCSTHEINTFNNPKFTRAFEILLTKNKTNTLCQRYLSRVQVESVKRR